MQSQQVLYHSWPYYTLNQSVDESFLYGLDMDLQMSNYEISSPVTASEDSFEMSSIQYFSVDVPSCGDDIQLMLPLDHKPNLEEFGYSSNENLLRDEIDDATQWMEEETISPQHSSNQEETEASLSSCVDMYTAVPLQSIILPGEAMETDNQISIPHLLQAYGDAIKNHQGELAEVIGKCIGEKVTVSGASIDRLAYYLFDTEGDHIKQESRKNYEAAFKAFYSIFPYGRCAHFTANLAILEAMPKNTEAVHIIDFDLGDGAQWPSLIEALGKQRLIRLTSVKRKDDDCVTPQWRFEYTKRHLCYQANSFGLNLEVDEMDMDAIITDISNRKGSEWVAFNCMSGLPHMGRSRSRRNAVNFVSMAKELISQTTKRSIVVFGDGEGTDGREGSSSSFGSFFNERLQYYNAMFESIDWHFPSHFTQAKIAMECLFLAPNVSSLVWFQKWKESEETCGVKSVFRTQGCRFSEENLQQAKEIVRGEGLYDVSVVGEEKSEIVLQWRGTPLVRVSAWN